MQIIDTGSVASNPLINSLDLTSMLRDLVVTGFGESGGGGIMAGGGGGGIFSSVAGGGGGGISFSLSEGGGRCIFLFLAGKIYLFLGKLIRLV